MHFHIAIAPKPVAIVGLVPGIDERSIVRWGRWDNTILDSDRYRYPDVNRVFDCG